jgi:deoxyhypusine synthase
MSKVAKGIHYSFPSLSKRQKNDKRSTLKERIRNLDLSSPKTVAELVDQFAGMSIQARNIGQCAKVLEQMYADRDRPTVLLGLAGPLIAAGLRKVIRDMIEYKMVDVVVSTGAILYQDYYQAMGFGHYKGSPEADDKALRDLYIDRIYDTYVDEEKFWLTDCGIGKFCDTLKPGLYSSRLFLEHLGSTVKDPNSILGTAFKHRVPVFSPALNDSSIGIGMTEHFHRCQKEGRKGVSIDSIRDNYEITQIIVKSKCTSAIYVAGGVPKNYINDAVVMAYIFNMDTGGHRYAIQVTTDVPHWGGLSGSTLSEATSWGKISKKATHHMAFVEPSVSLPLLAGFALEKKLSLKRPRLKFAWNGCELKKVEY